jgi:protein-disulfide isomerase
MYFQPQTAIFLKEGEMKNKIAGLFLFALIAGSAEQKSLPPGKTLGVSTAPITIEVFSDYECSHCKQLYEETLRPLMRDYVSKGKVYFIHRDYPLPQHVNARPAACLANASRQVNKYEEVCAALFRQQAIWSANGNIEAAVATVLTPVELTKVRLLAKDPKITAEMEGDIALGQKLHVSQTPTMVITHKGRSSPVTGYVNYSFLRSYLDDLLSK